MAMNARLATRRSTVCAAARVGGRRVAAPAATWRAAPTPAARPAFGAPALGAPAPLAALRGAALVVDAKASVGGE